MRHPIHSRSFVIIAGLAAVAAVLAATPASAFATNESGGAGHALDPTVLVGVAAMLVDR